MRLILVIVGFKIIKFYYIINMTEPASYAINISGNSNDSNLLLASNNGTISSDFEGTNELQKQMTELKSVINANISGDLLQEAGIESNTFGITTNLNRLDVHETLVLKNIADISNLNSVINANISGDLLQQAGIDSNNAGIVANLNRLDVDEALVTQNIADSKCCK